MKDKNSRSAGLAAIFLTCLTIAALLTLPGRKRGGPDGFDNFMPSAPTAEAASFSPWKQAVQKLKEDRGEPTGKQAQVAIPPQLRHYSDTRRFLAVQVAEWREHRFETPHDFADLAGLIKKGEMIELKPVSENYILYGVGGSADKEPFTHYDKSNGRSIPLYNESELSGEYARIAQAFETLEDRISGLKSELNSSGKAERAKRLKIQAQISAEQKSVKALVERKEILDATYGDAERRQQLLANQQMLETLASDFSGRAYDIEEARSRQEMKVRMLSFLRPTALKILEEIASSYRQQFDRPLPITSLVRPDEYQHALSKVNPNATQIDIPPHSTGLAFDIYYRFMTAAEQSHVMATLARLKDEGRIEVLRENRDHYHVFAFTDEVRPSEALILESIAGRKASVKVAKETRPSEALSEKDKKKDGRKVAQREATKQKKGVKGKRR